MFNKKDYECIVETIRKTNWDDNAKVKNNNIIIEQFQGTAFDSDYQCYKVTKKEWIQQGESMLQGKTLIFQLVVKITNILETKVLEGLNKLGFPVPKLCAKVSYGKQVDNVIIFEEFVQGRELYSVGKKEAWITSAEVLAKVHLKYWDEDLQSIFNLSDEETNRSISDFENKIYRAQMNISHKLEWKKTFSKICERIGQCPKTLVHGDLFSTNILVSGEMITFLDWANAGEFPYFMDIARLTGMLNKDSGEVICPNQENVYQRYFEIVADKLQIDYEMFVKDISMGQFVELAATYFPPVSLNVHSLRVCSDYNIAVENRLNKLSKIILS